MTIHFSAVIARERKTGKIVIVAQAVGMIAGGADLSEVANVHEQFRASNEQGAELRAKYSHMLFLVDNAHRAAYEFPDASVLQAAVKARAIEEAQRDLASAEAASREAADLHGRAAEAKDRADAARARLAELTGQPLPTPARVIIVPTLAEVMKAGYAKESAVIIVLQEQAKADALAENPEITDAELSAIAEDVRIQHAPAPVVKPQAEPEPVTGGEGAPQLTLPPEDEVVPGDEPGKPAAKRNGKQANQ